MKDIHRSAPRMGFYEIAMKLLAAVPDLSRRKTRKYVLRLVMKLLSMTEGLIPDVTLIMFGT